MKMRINYRLLLLQPTTTLISLGRWAGEGVGAGGLDEIDMKKEAVATD